MTDISILCLFCSTVMSFLRTYILPIVKSDLFFLLSLEGTVTWLLNGLRVKLKNKSNTVIFRALLSGTETQRRARAPQPRTAQQHVAAFPEAGSASALLPTARLRPFTKDTSKRI